MALATFADVKSSIQSWMLDRTDLSAANIEDFIALVEADANKVLRTSYQETLSALTPTDGGADLPADYLAWRHVYIDTTPRRALNYLDLMARDRVYQIQSNGPSDHFYITGTTTSGRAGKIGVLNRPTEDIQLVYYAEIPALSDSNTTNWLLTLDPWTYVAGGCLYAARFLRDADAEKQFGTDFTSRLSLIAKADRDVRWQRVQSISRSNVRP